MKSKYDEPLFQIREFGDGTWSVTARIWVPQKQIYEDPELINLTEEQAREQCQKYIDNPISAEDIMENWLFIAS